jgi:hypothetical protein
VSERQFNQLSHEHCPDAGETSGVPLELPSQPPDQPHILPAASPGLHRNMRNFWLLPGGGSCLVAMVLAGCAGLVVSLVFTVVTVPAPRTSDAVPAAPEAVLSTSQTDTVDREILLQDTLANATASDMIVDEDAFARYIFEDERYLILVRPADQIAWSLAEGIYDDTVVVQVTTSVDSDPDQVASGIIFHYQDEDNFYLYSVSGNGFYSLELLKDNKWLSLIDWTPSEAIAVASAAETDPTNTLRVARQGSRITLFVNNVRVEETVDSTFTQGEVGLATITFGAGDGRVYFNDLLIARPASAMHP